MVTTSVVENSPTTSWGPKGAGKSQVPLGGGWSPGRIRSRWPRRTTRRPAVFSPASSVPRVGFQLSSATAIEISSADGQPAIAAVASRSPSTPAGAPRDQEVIVRRS